MMLYFWFQKLRKMFRSHGITTEMHIPEDSFTLLRIRPVEIASQIIILERIASCDLFKDFHRISFYDRDSQDCSVMLSRSVIGFIRHTLSRFGFDPLRIVRSTTPRRHRQKPGSRLRGVVRLPQAGDAFHRRKIRLPPPCSPLRPRVVLGDQMSFAGSAGENLDRRLITVVVDRQFFPRIVKRF